ncbi:MAG TPA: hypothetical protein VHP31_02635 [Caproicibacter sp.]|nr:hypothetical protein [Caproicibacter sp.]
MGAKEDAAEEFAGLTSGLDEAALDDTSFGEDTSEKIAWLVLLPAEASAGTICSPHPEQRMKSTVAEQTKIVCLSRLKFMLNSSGETFSSVYHNSLIPTRLLCCLTCFYHTIAIIG